MTSQVDLLKIKIDQAKSELPQETVNAIAAVDWHAAILGMRAKRGYSFEQLGDLETETELVLAGLLKPDDYTKELETRMRISGAEARELVAEMNMLVFSKIREEMIKNAEKQKTFVQKDSPIETMYPPRPQAPKATEPAMLQIPKADHEVLNNAGIEIKSEAMPVLEKLELESPEKIRTEVHPILAQKLAGYVQNEVKETKHSIDTPLAKENPAASTPAPALKTPTPVKKPASYLPNQDPYRLPPE